MCYESIVCCNCVLVSSIHICEDKTIFTHFIFITICVRDFVPFALSFTDEYLFLKLAEDTPQV